MMLPPRFASTKPCSARLMASHNCLSSRRSLRANRANTFVAKTLKAFSAPLSYTPMGDNSRWGRAKRNPSSGPAGRTTARGCDCAPPIPAPLNEWFRPPLATLRHSADIYISAELFPKKPCCRLNLPLPQSAKTVPFIGRDWSFPRWILLLIKIFATALTFSQVTDRAGCGQDAIRSHCATSSRSSAILRAGCTHMRKAFDIEDINLDDLIATAMDDPEAVAGANPAVQGPEPQRPARRLQAVLQERAAQGT